MSNGIIHSVIFNLKHETGSDEAKQFLMDGKAILSGIPTVQNFVVYKQVSAKNDYSYGFSMYFEDEAAFMAYNEHPDHVAFVRERWETEVTSFLEIDYEQY